MTENVSSDAYIRMTRHFAAHEVFCNMCARSDMAGKICWGEYFPASIYVQKSTNDGCSALTISPELLQQDSYSKCQNVIVPMYGHAVPCACYSGCMCQKV